MQDRDWWGPSESGRISACLSEACLWTYTIKGLQIPAIKGSGGIDGIIDQVMDWEDKENGKAERIRDVLAGRGPLESSKINQIRIWEATNTFRRRNVGTNESLTSRARQKIYWEVDSSGEWQRGFKERNRDPSKKHRSPWLSFKCIE